MRLPNYQFVAQMSAALAVVISLGFVAYELKLARDIAKAEVYQARTAMDQNYRISTFDSAALHEVFRKVDRGEALSDEEVKLRVINADIAIMTAENVFYQYQLGLLDEEEWAVWLSNMGWMLETPCYRSYFERNRNGFRKPFADEIDKLFATSNVPDCPLDKRE